jgi:hypothetical protein
MVSVVIRIVLGSLYMGSCEVSVTTFGEYHKLAFVRVGSEAIVS